MQRLGKMETISACFKTRMNALAYYCLYICNSGAKLHSFNVHKITVILILVYYK